MRQFKGSIIFNANSTITLSPVNFQATQLVLKAHKEAVNFLSGNGSAQLGKFATVVGAANSIALESSKEIEAVRRISMKDALGNMMASRPAEAQMDDMAIMTVCCCSQLTYNTSSLLTVMLLIRLLFQPDFYSG